jgi:hypothetical protein
MQQPPRPVFYDYIDDTLERCIRSASQIRFMTQELLPLMFNKYETLYSVCSVELMKIKTDNMQLHQYLSHLLRKYNIDFDNTLTMRGNQVDWLYMQRSIQSLHEDSDKEDFLIAIQEKISFLHKQYLRLLNAYHAYSLSLIPSRRVNGDNSEESVILNEHINKVCATLYAAWDAIKET